MTKNPFFKKLIIVIGSVVVIAGVSLFAYWMSTLNAPPDKDTEFTIIIGVGDGSGAFLYVKEDLEAKELNFVPKDRLEHDSIGDNNVSSHVFTLNICWLYTPEKELKPGEEEKGVLLANITRFNFYDAAGTPKSGHLTIEQQAELASLFLVELGYQDNEGNFTPETGNFLISPDGKRGDEAPFNYQEIHLRLTFLKEAHNKTLRDLIINENYDLQITLEVERVVVVDKP